jgi:hypothetical protein
MKSRVSRPRRHPRRELPESPPPRQEIIVTEAVAANLYGVEPEREPPDDEIGGCTCGAKFYSYEEFDEHQYDCPLPDPLEREREPVATLVPGTPASLNLPATRQPLIFARDDGALNVHPLEPGPANCCDGRMVYIFVNRGGTTRCPTCDGKRVQS